VSVSLGGAAILSAEGEPLGWATTDPRSVSVSRAGQRLVVAGRAAGRALVATRGGQAQPELLAVEVGAPLAPAEGEVRVAVGAVRRLTPDRPARAVEVADPTVASAELRGLRLVVRGMKPGRTHLVVVLDDGPVLVVLAVAAR
jgi:Pilus formation protein N terminal region